LANGATLTHNHPRGKGEEGQLGGTFSAQDMRTFSNNRMSTMRASAAEGTYSITKTAGFDRSGFSSYISSIHKKNDSIMQSAHKQLTNDIVSGKVTGYREAKKRSDAIFNAFLINLHNDMIAGQKQYGYTYTLERRG